MMTGISASFLIDGFSEAPATNPLVLFEDGRIREVISHSPYGGPPYEEIGFFEGATIIPGLIDCHVHLTFDATSQLLDHYLSDSNDFLLLKAANHARRALEGGITTVRDLGARDDVIFSLKEAIRENIVSGPDLLVAGRPITSMGGHCHFMHGEVGNSNDIVHLIRSQVGKGADVTKLVVNGGGLTQGTSCLKLQFSYDEIRVAVEESHSLGKKVAAHADCPAAIEISAQAGVDTIEHCEFLNPDGLRIDEGILKLLVDRQVYVVPTLSPWYVIRNEVKSWSTLSELNHSFRQYWEEILEVTKRFKEAGLRVIAGSDAGCPDVPHDSLLMEIELLTYAGLSRMEAIHAATGVAAQALGIEDRGTIQVGKRADLVVVEGNPFEDLGALRKPLLVIKEGQVVVDRRKQSGRSRHENS